MSRNARVVVAEVPHHITSRGIRGADVFRDREDYKLYSRLLSENCPKFEVLIRAYTWMTNHSHLVAIPMHPESLSGLFRRVNSIYARLFNEKYGLRGYVWQDRFYSSPLDERHFWSAVRYVERNPVRAKMVARAEDYEWSSAVARCRGIADPLLDPSWTPTDVIPDWSKWLEFENASHVNQLIREKTTKGHACGDDQFVSDLEVRFGRPLRPQKPGRRGI